MEPKEECCCCTLKQGTVTVGVVYTVSNAISFLYFAFAEFAKQEYPTKKEEDLLLGKKVIGTILSAVACFFSVLILVGVSKGNRLLLLPWLILAAIGLVAGVMVVIKFLIHGVFLLALIFLASFALNVYCASVVYKYYKHLKKRNILPTTTFTPAAYPAVPYIGTPAAPYRDVPYAATPTAPYIATTTEQYK